MQAPATEVLLRVPVVVAAGAVLTAAAVTTQVPRAPAGRVAARVVRQRAEPVLTRLASVPRGAAEATLSLPAATPPALVLLETILRALAAQGWAVPVW
jgi:hypothetical protein